jgi:transcriptional regulator with XRE-family HTH domain
MAHDLMDLFGPALLAWARTTADLTLQDAAASLGVTADVLDGWEHGQGRPTLCQLRSLGQIYDRKVGLFFLPAPPLDQALGRGAGAGP